MKNRIDECFDGLAEMPITDYLKALKIDADWTLDGGEKLHFDTVYELCEQFYKMGFQEGLQRDLFADVNRLLSEISIEEAEDETNANRTNAEIAKESLRKTGFLLDEWQECSGQLVGV